MNERRNYYRVLHVQPEAPLEVIKASYRTIMHKLKHHPDLGGSHAYASLLNEAYATLSDAKRRAHYDAQLSSRHPPAPDKAKARTTQVAPQYKIHCRHCQALNVGSVSDRPLRCATCGHSLRAQPTKTCQRTLARLAQRGDIKCLAVKSLAGHGAAFTGKIIDISPRGVGFNSPYPLPYNQVIEIQSPLFQATARVVHCRASHSLLSTQHSVGAVFINVTFAKPQGTFISVAA